MASLAPDRSVAAGRKLAAAALWSASGCDDSAVWVGGGTDINRALAYCQGLVRRPDDTIVILISDLIEGGIREEMLKRAGSMVASGAQMIALLALSDEGVPA